MINSNETSTETATGVASKASVFEQWISDAAKASETSAPKPRNDFVHKKNESDLSGLSYRSPVMSVRNEAAVESGPLNVMKRVRAINAAI